MKKAVLVSNLMGVTLVTLMSEIKGEVGRAEISYFVDGREVTDWSTLAEVARKNFTEAANILCEQHSLTKWSY